MATLRPGPRASRPSNRTMHVLGRSRLPLALFLLPFLAAACGRGGPDRTLDRQTFIDVYVELRLAALGTPTGQISPERRDQILAAHGIDEEALLYFVAVHGRDIDFMARVWTDVEERLQQPANPPDEAL